jgi:hypothetical protein
MKSKGWRGLLALLVCCLLPWGAMAQEPAQPLELAQPLEGVWTYPQGASPEEADYVLHYAYPQFVAATQGDQAINAYYQAVCQDIQNLFLPQNVEEMLSLREPEAPPYTADLTWQVTANTDQYVSVILSNKQFLGRTETESLQANVFARDGMYAGQMVSLSQVMGLEQEGGEFDARASYASQLVYRLVWEIIRQQSASRQKDFLEGLTQEQLQAQFTPETDFYLDGDENLVFFLQAGTIASEVEGILTYPFSMAELLSAARE